MESQNQTTVSQTTPKVIYQPIGDARGLPELKLTDLSGDSLEWLEWAEIFDVTLHQKRLSYTEKMQYLKISLTGQAKAAISGFVSAHRHILKPEIFSARNLANP